MKIIDMALKDLLSAFRSAFAVSMMLIVPLMITALIAFAFGGFGSSKGFELPLTRVQMVNNDHESAMGGINMGQVLLDTLNSEDLADLLQVVEAPDEAAARAAVDRQEAQVAVIVPAGFTQAALTGQQGGAVTLYQDPTLSVGPGLVKMLVSGVLDGFSGSQIAVNTINAQLQARGQTFGMADFQRVAVQYGEWAQAQGEALQAGTHPGVRAVHPAGKAQTSSQRQAMMGGIMAGMMIFFAFFTGTSVAQTIIREDEEGTLARLFTTPTPRPTILAGKFVSILVTVLVQIIVLLVASRLIFGIRWGQLGVLALMVLGSVVAASGFGLFLMSFVKTTKQAGPVIGVVVTMTGMLGGLMTTGVSNAPAAFQIANYLVPQGWVMGGWKAVLIGGRLGEVGPMALAAVIYGLLLFVVGAYFFRKRLI